MAMDDKLTKKFLVVIILLILIGAGLMKTKETDTTAIGQKYLMALHYDGKNLVLEQLEIRQGQTPDRRVQPDTGFMLKVISFDEEVLHSFRFKIELFAADLGELKETDYVLAVPYFENAKTIEIYDSDGSLALSIDVTPYSRNRNLQ